MEAKDLNRFGVDVDNKDTIKQEFDNHEELKVKV